MSWFSKTRQKLTGHNPYVEGWIGLILISVMGIAMVVVLWRLW